MTVPVPDAIRATAIEAAKKAQIASHSFIASDGYTSVAIHDNDEAAERAVDAVLPAVVAQVQADAWDEGALWAAVELGAIRNEHQTWLAPGDNPYREKGENSHE